LRVDIFDIDDETKINDLSKQELIGTAEFLLSDVMNAREQTVKMPLQNPKRLKNGFVILKAEKVAKMSGDIVKILFEGQMKSKGKYFFRLLRAKDNSVEYLPVYQSESCTYNGNIARWRIVKIGAAGLMRDNPAYPLMFELYEYRSSGNHTVLFTSKFTYAQLVESPKFAGSFGIFNE